MLMWLILFLLDGCPIKVFHLCSGEEQTQEKYTCVDRDISGTLRTEVEHSHKMVHSLNIHLIESQIGPSLPNKISGDVLWDLKNVQLPRLLYRL